MTYQERYYILDGHNVIPVSDALTWSMKFDKDDSRRVALDHIGDDVKVSTVFIGLDYSSGDGPPQVFETMVFGGALDQEVERYATWDEAERGHAEMVQRVKGAL